MILSKTPLRISFAGGGSDYFNNFSETNATIAQLQAAPPHLDRIFRRQRLQKLQHCGPAPVPVNFLEFMKIREEVARFGAAGALANVRVCVASAVSHAPAAKRAAAKMIG